MGSGVSKSDANGVTMPSKFRPIFLQRIEEFASRRYSRPFKDSTPSKKELLSHDNDNYENNNHGKKSVERKSKAKGSDEEKNVATRIDTTHDVVKVENWKTKGKDERKENVVQDEKDKEEDVFKDFDDEDEDDDDDDSEEEEDGRMIGHQDDDAFPGSPSFRVYYNDNGEDVQDDDDFGKDEVHQSIPPSSDIVSVSIKDPSVRKKGKRGRKRRSFKNVFQQGGQAAVKNILNVTSCYTPSHASHERNSLLPIKQSLER